MLRRTRLIQRGNIIKQFQKQAKIRYISGPLIKVWNEYIVMNPKESENDVYSIALACKVACLILLGVKKVWNLMRLHKKRPPNTKQSLPPNTKNVIPLCTRRQIHACMASPINFQFKSMFNSYWCICLLLLHTRSWSRTEMMSIINVLHKLHAEMNIKQLKVKIKVILTIWLLAVIVN